MSEEVESTKPAKGLSTVQAIVLVLAWLMAVIVALAAVFKSSPYSLMANAILALLLAAVLMLTGVRKHGLAVIGVVVLAVGLTILRGVLGF